MFDQMREHYDSIASRWEIDHERFAGEEIDPWDGLYDDDPAGTVEDLAQDAQRQLDADPNLWDLTDLVRQHEEDNPPF